jgi:hypothetical protein
LNMVSLRLSKIKTKIKKKNSWKVLAKRVNY